jgi:hypothetical protein
MPIDNYFFRTENVIASKHNVTPVKAEAISLKPMAAPPWHRRCSGENQGTGKQVGDGPNHRYDKQTSGTSRTSNFSGRSETIARKPAQLAY